MPKPRAERNAAYVRVALGALVCTLLLAGCSRGGAGNTSDQVGAGSAADPIVPSAYSVKGGQFVQSVDIGDKALVVTPPPLRTTSVLTLAKATALFEADDSFKGTYSFDVVGLGLATIREPAIKATSYLTGSSSHLQDSSPTTTPTTSAPPTSTPTTTSPTTAPGSSTTSSAPPTTTPTTATPVPSLPAYDKRLSWVGIAVAESPASCTPDTPSAVAVVIDADTGGDVVSVTALGCGSSTSAQITLPQELESVAWEPVGASSTAVVARIPACGRYVGWTNTYVDGVAFTEVEVAAPYDPDCGTTARTQVTINLVVPLGSSGTSPPHAPGGPIDNLDVLPTSVPPETTTTS